VGFPSKDAEKYTLDYSLQHQQTCDIQELKKYDEKPF
jgi:hypothetical protein